MKKALSAKRKLSSFDFSRTARGTLRRLKKITGWSKTRIVEESLFQAERTNAFDFKNGGDK